MWRGGVFEGGGWMRMYVLTAVWPLDWQGFKPGGASPEQESLCVWSESALSWITQFVSLAV